MEKHNPNTPFCQSCGMPLTDESLLGTEKDGAKNPDYCLYCYKDGAFTSDCTMEQMIDFCVPILTRQMPGLSAEAARAQMNQFFPQLKRWKKDCCIHFKGGFQMDVTRRIFPACTLIGREGSTEEGEGFIQRLWTEANAHFEEIRSITVQPLVLYGAMSDPARTLAPWTDGFTRGLYLAGAQVQPGSAAPDGWTRWELPAMECLCTPQHPDAIPQMMAHLKAESLTLAAAIQERTEMADGVEMLCFPIRLL